MPTIQDGKNAITAGNVQQARLIFEAILQENSRDEEAWLGLAEALTETNDKRICYENVLKINKNNQVAREGLRSLEPEEDPFVAALKQQTAAVAEDEEAPDWIEAAAGEETMVSDQRSGAVGATADEGSETPTPVLVAVGLGLSIIVFAIVAGVAFFVLTSLTVP
ncbi:MAG: tetratricopeptide repeat protein [Anaerolineae bacterium]|nr:tetratricopeptide repeat protein [Anaerolineae bacterium]